MNDFWKEHVTRTLVSVESPSISYARFLLLFGTFDRLCTMIDKNQNRTPKKNLIARLIFSALNAFEKHSILFSIPDDVSELKKTIWVGNAKGGSIPFHSFHRRNKQEPGTTDLSYRKKWLPDENDSDPRWAVADLFIKSYFVRNNLFHGWKTPEGPFPGSGRNPALIKESNRLLENFLKNLVSLPTLPGMQNEILARFETFGQYESRPSRTLKPRKSQHENH